MRNKEFIFATCLLIIISFVFGIVVHRILTVDVSKLPDDVSVNPFLVLGIFIPCGILISCIVNWDRIKKLYFEEKH